MGAAHSSVAPAYPTACRSVFNRLRPQPAQPALGATAALAAQDTLLAVLDKLSHDEQILNRLHAFVSRHCEHFEAEGEQRLVLHDEYKRLFEDGLASVLYRARISPSRFAELMEAAVANGSAEAHAIQAMATAVDDYAAFAALMRSRRRQLMAAGPGSGDGADGLALSQEQREELRAHMWGHHHALRSEAIAATGASEALEEGTSGGCGATATTGAAAAEEEVTSHGTSHEASAELAEVAAAVRHQLSVEVARRSAPAPRAMEPCEQAAVDAAAEVAPHHAGVASAADASAPAEGLLWSSLAGETVLLGEECKSCSHTWTVRSGLLARTEAAIGARHAAALAAALAARAAATDADDAAAAEQQLDVLELGSWGTPRATPRDADMALDDVQTELDEAMPVAVPLPEQSWWPPASRGHGVTVA